ncbi:family 2 glycosyl transferase [Gloeomargarita lithophora Alchichica-D10]|uniref:Family 2 glycosyl transferase n=1 Tax=Gloeomargarita lithophora Alchichica-D10 TaxID=1188229 RepID=A0A1J0AH90_9CYAN|nr:glycosyltransferase [Gloeomargarita lithophora]APB35287.1 family 2 glycosyl transferase [Gloeomargarita lithophora Alchichica-D10]
MFFSVIIPTYNRRPILAKALLALENQNWEAQYEVIVVDDGSTDDTLAWLTAHRPQLSHVTWVQQHHQGPAAARNLGVAQAQGDTIVFIDSDLVVTPVFLRSHGEKLQAAYAKLGHQKCFTYGRVVNTANFEEPTSEPFKITDRSRAFFATGNVAIAKSWLELAGGFDADFQFYGWEDLELGVRLKSMGLILIPCPSAVGYHWHPPFELKHIPSLIDKEIQRAKMGVLFYQKHPTWEVRLMIQMTWLHRVLWAVLSLGGQLNEHTLAPLMQRLIDRGQSQWAWEISRIFLNQYNVRAVYAAYQEWRLASQR